MKNFFTDNSLYCELKTTLQNLFSQKLTRYSRPKDISSATTDVQSFAYQIYKRGLIDTLKNQTNIAKFSISNQFFMPKREFKSNLKQYFQHIQNTLSSTFFIIDKNVYDIYQAEFTLLEKNQYYILDAQENLKSLETVKNILINIQNQFENKFQKESSNKSSYRIAGIGGGITLDIAGFVASILQSKLILLPTTLLAAVDATIGGKTGVNFESFGKNQVGSFYFCDEIFVIPELFLSLKKQEIVSGFCEILKHSWIVGSFLNDRAQFEAFYQSLQNNQFNAFLILNQNFFQQLIHENLDLKLSIVEKDPFDTNGTRAVLNFGHTIGHAIETISQTQLPKIPHGIAVAHGMHFVLTHHDKLVSSNLESFKASLLNNENEVKHFQALLHKIIQDYPFSKIDVLAPEFSYLLLQDKKNQKQNLVEFVTPHYGLLSKQ